MPFSSLDPRSALVVIDLQRGIATGERAHPVAEIVARSAALAAAFRRHELPVVLVNVTGGAPGRTEGAMFGAAARPEGWEVIVDDLDAQPGDIRITKRTWGAFTGTPLEQTLRELGVTELVLCGIATSAGVESTARHAHELGFNVALVVDAMTDASLEAHENSVTRIFPRLGETGTTQQLLELLELLDADRS